MKKQLFVFYVLINLYSAISQAQSLSPVAQALYDETYNADTLMAQLVLSNGAQVFATPDSSSFYLQWFPNGANPSTTPLIVSLHGSGGRAFVEINNWYSEAQLHGCGIIALQWYRGAASLPPNDYLNDTAIYTDIVSVLTGFNYPSGKAFLHGFSRGSARSYAIVFLDSHGGNNYFCTALSNSGSAGLNYPLYAQIDSGNYGNNVFAGKQWALFCGGQDTNLTQSGCPGMSNTETWLQSQGASVGIFIQDSTLGHDGFHLVPAYIDSVLNYYLSCYNGTTIVNSMNSGDEFEIFPNPFSSGISLTIKKRNYKDASLTIQDILGHVIFREEGNIFDSSNTRRVDLSKIQKGIYFLTLKIDNSRVMRKIIKQ